MLEGVAIPLLMEGGTAARPASGLWRRHVISFKWPAEAISRIKGLDNEKKMKRVNEAVKVFDELENSNSKADIISYNSLINCQGKNGDLDEVQMRFKEM
ncbi:hypothetical protein RJ639_042570 [Escallonia herrerae]|uniref:Pentatricopeptide repeat-containing protein n=1 Tax=Escallonia herrerae TaxID=1293975 RepID=A0AA88WEF9_9ASTE|nr:hypothetical protein RJ639_042570 [Escallonia herrerae]